MKNLIGGLLIVSAVTGFCSCADKIERYVDNPKTILEDPLTVNYQQDLEDLERKYLHKEISYGDYLEQKKRLDDTYSQKVQRRQQIIETGAP